MSGEVTRTTWLLATWRSTWHPTPQYGQTERTILSGCRICSGANRCRGITSKIAPVGQTRTRSEEHTSELQSPCNLVCRLLLEKKKKSERDQQSRYVYLSSRSAPRSGRSEDK